MLTFGKKIIVLAKNGIKRAPQHSSIFRSTANNPMVKNWNLTFQQNWQKNEQKYGVWTKKNENQSNVHKTLKKRNSKILLIIFFTNKKPIRLYSYSPTKVGRTETICWCAKLNFRQTEYHTKKVVSALFVSVSYFSLIEKVILFEIIDAQKTFEDQSN